MKRVSFTLCFLSLSLTGVVAADHDSLGGQIKSIMSHWGAPGVVISIVKDGEVLLSRGYGTTRVEGGVTPEGGTLVSVASVSKTFNSVVLGMLLEDGRLSLDDPVRLHIPEFQFGDVMTSKNATVRDLIIHRVGLPAVMGGFRNMDYSIDALLEGLPAAEPRIPFREKLDYSQVGIAIIGEAIARAGGESWPDLVRSRILKPLGMASTYPGGKAFFDAHGDDPDQVSGLMGRAIRRDGEIVDGPWTAVNEVYTPAGGLVTTADDMTQYMLFLLNGGVHEGRRLITEKTLAELWAPQMIERSPYGELINPVTSVKGYAHGWMVHELSGHLVVEHPGSNFGSSTVALVHAKGVGVFVSSNANYSLASDQMVSALKLTALEYALGIEPHEWIAVFDALN